MASDNLKKTLTPEQQLVLDELQLTLQKALDTACNDKGKSEFVYVHHGALIPSPAEYDLVYDRVYIGGEKLAREIAALEKANITHVVNCAEGKKFGQVNTGVAYYNDSAIEYFGIPGHDSIKFDISIYFAEAAKFIHHGSLRGNVYVHCHQGISRSSAVVIAYLMIYHNMTAVEALGHILQSRIVMPNKGFLKALSIFQCENDKSVGSTSAVAL